MQSSTTDLTALNVPGAAPFMNPQWGHGGFNIYDRDAINTQFSFTSSTVERSFI